MLHNIGRFILRIGAEFFFGKHHIKNLERLNNGRPMVVCSNHTAAQLDGVLIMIFSKRKFHVLVSADVFNRKWVANLLANINLIPIYRMRDGFSRDIILAEARLMAYDIGKLRCRCPRQRRANITASQPLQSAYCSLNTPLHVTARTVFRLLGFICR